MIVRLIPAAGDLLQDLHNAPAGQQPVESQRNHHTHTGIENTVEGIGDVGLIRRIAGYLV